MLCFRFQSDTSESVGVTELSHDLTGVNVVPDILPMFCAEDVAFLTVTDRTEFKFGMALQTTVNLFEMSSWGDQKHFAF